MLAALGGVSSAYHLQARRLLPPPLAALSCLSSVTATRVVSCAKVAEAHRLAVHCS